MDAETDPETQAVAAAGPAYAVAGTYSPVVADDAHAVQEVTGCPTCFEEKPEHVHSDTATSMDEVPVTGNHRVRPEEIAAELEAMHQAAAARKGPTARNTEKVTDTTEEANTVNITSISFCFSWLCYL